MKAMKQTTKRLLAMFLAFLMVFTMIPTASFAAEGSAQAEASESPSAYGYDETNAESVKVNVTLSNDGFPIVAQDGTALSHLEVTVPYFDLANYDLQDYYRYGTENGSGSYVGTELIKRPTLLHLYIYLIERYYMGVPADECGTGTSGIFEYAEDNTVYYLGDEVAYRSNGTNAMSLSGAATSMYMNNFWGHSENLMYYRNHRYPLMSAGWGSTADYILLSDGDRIDLGMFSNWMFYVSGAFLSFDKEAYEANTGETFQVTTKYTGSSAVNDSGETPILDYTEALNLQLYNDKWESVEFKYTELGNGTYEITAPSTGGTYYVLASDPNAKTSDSDKAPATAVVNVEEKVEEGVYEVIVNVAPSTANVTFYAGQNAEEALPANRVTDNGVVEKYHQYVLKVKEGDYSYRAVEEETALGGMAFKVPVSEEIMEDGNASGEGQSMTLLRTNWYTTNAAITNIGDYTLRLMPGSLPQAVNGDQYIDANNRVVTPVMVLARGNALTYQAAITVNGELAESYAVSPLSNLTFSATAASTSNKTFSLNAIVYDTITAPKEAKVQMFNQLKNFNVEEIPAKSFNDNEDGTRTYNFATPGGSNLTYRVSMDGKITRAGYMSRNAENLTFTFEENEDPSTTENKMDNSNMQGRIESSTLLNVNAQNNLKLGVGETFRLRSYRGAWQIINTDTANIMIEPDFNYKILSGEEHIELTPAANRCTGNAGSGDSSNWMDIKGVSEGTAVLEVTYDAIQIGGEGTSYDGLYGATDPQRKSLVIINVGESGNTLTVTADGTNHTWDTEFDTVYFPGETGSLTFTAILGEDAPEKIELSTDNGKTWTEVEAADGKYTAKGLVGGNNILKVTKGDITEYQVIRAAKVTYTIINKTRENDLIAGDTVEVTFKGMYTPLSKFSGIYNPGFAKPNHNIAYTLPEGVTSEASGGQYNFITNHSYKVTFENAGEITLTNGHIYHTNMGSAPGEHRKLTDDGVGSNFNASNGNWERSVFPDLTFNVIEMPIIPVTLDVDVEDATIVLTDETGTELTAENDVYNLEYATYTYVISKEGYVTERGSFTVSSKDGDSKTVTIHMRKIEGAIWDGTSVTEPAIVDGLYQIGTGAELAWFAQNAGKTGYEEINAILTADISLGGFNWTPIANDYGWKGIFDGDGHYVTDLYINSTSNNVALFGYVSTGAVIKNLGVKGEVTTTGRTAAGIVTAKVASVKFSVENCKSEVNVSAQLNAAGIISGQSANQTVKNCYNTGKIKITKSGSSSSLTGGGVSCPSSQTQKIVIENSYNAGNISGVGKHGSVAYVNSASNAVNVKNSYGLIGTCGTKTVAGTDVTASELRNLAETLGDAYMANPTSYNNGYPILTWEEGRILPIIREEAKAELAAYKNAEDYREAEALVLAEIINNAVADIDATETTEAVAEIVKNAKAEMDALKTDTQYKDEELEAELAAALAAAKEAAKKKIAEYKNTEEYGETEKAELANIINNATTAIDAAETVEAVAKIVEDAKTAMDTLPVIVPVDPADDCLDIPVDMYTTSAGSTQPGNSTNAAIDGNDGSFWEVVWDIGNDDPSVLWYQVELEDEVEIQAVRYLPRWGTGQGDQNGFVADYQVLVSADGEEWTVAAEGSWEMTEGWKIAQFDEAVTTKYVRLFATGTYADVGENSNMSIAEFRVKATSVVINKTALKAAIAEAEGLVAEDYVNMSDVNTALAAAKKALTAESQEEVDAAAAALNEAIAALVKIVKKDALKEAIKDAKEVDQSLYTSATAKALADAIAAGEALADDEKATQEAVDAATAAIKSAKSALKAKATAAEKAALQEAVDAAEAMDTSEYTEESVAALHEAIAAAKAVLDDADATSKDVKDAADELQEAADALEIPVVEDEVVRLFGQGRYDTAYAVADQLKAVLGVEKFEAVVVATGKNFADALAGSYLAVEKNAPILLTNGKDDNIAELHAYITANVAEGGTVYILGGEGAVPKAVDEIHGYDVVRLFGDSRYDTNLEILKEAGVSGDSIIVATGKNFADSLSASAAKLPILLVKPDATLNDDQKPVLDGMKNIYIVGGEGAVSAEYESELTAFGEVTRVYGESRYDTSVEVAKTFCKDVDFAVVASGKNFPDGLCGGPLAAALDASLVLTKDGGADAAAAYVAENEITSGYVLGGDSALTNDTVVEVFALESTDEIK